MAAFIQIPKTMSSPADPDAPSFLSNLPPEIRNAIYELLFKRDEPVLLHDPEAWQITAPSPSDYDSDDWAKSIRDFDERFEAEIGSDAEFKHDSHEGLSLLLSCRQVYHESIGVFYSDNTFVVSRAHARCDDEGSSSFQLDYVPVWLRNIGSQFSLVTEIHIDVDTMCLEFCDYSRDELELLPLLRYIWKGPQERPAIRFVQTGRRLSRHPANEHSAVARSRSVTH
jgi:hypothetical protein